MIINKNSASVRAALNCTHNFPHDVGKSVINYLDARLRIKRAIRGLSDKIKRFFLNYFDLI